MRLLLLFFASWAILCAQSTFDVDARLFSVIAAINAAGYDADLDSPNCHPLRAEVRRIIAAKNPGVLPELKRFFAEHKRATSAEELSQYVSFALSTRSAPDFEFRFTENELPPDVRKLAGFDRLMNRFHREAGIDDLMAKYQPVFEQALAKQQATMTEIIQQVNGYTRTPNVAFLGRSFKVYLDLLGAPNVVLTRNYQDDYFVVATPSADPPVSYIRNAYFKFVIDPLTLKYSEELNAKRGLIDYAQNSSLDDIYKEDFLLLAGGSLIKAIEARLAPSGERQAVLSQSLKEGWVVAPAFFDQLMDYEKQEQSMRLYFPELIKGINLKREEKRLEAVDFFKSKPVRKAKVVAEAPKEPELTGFAKTIDDADRLIEKRQTPPAKEMLLALLKETQEKRWAAKAYFGLARIAVLDRDPETGFKLFETTIETSQDPQVTAWSHYYLGRLHELASEPELDQAAARFEAALATAGGSAKVRQLAEQALAEIKKKRQ